MSMTKKDEENIRRTERKILRAIMAPKKINENEYRRRINEEIKEEYSGDIIKRIKWGNKEEATEVKLVERSQRGYSEGRGRKYRGKSKGRNELNKYYVGRLIYPQEKDPESLSGEISKEMYKP
ncbi:hypothetical protein ILUMI_04337 [Ignelater luminosus]|uniref:Uncharacterized protein n=1 Tax=Ignelater luminosus TaxID=2038154 RepID=A0A8K0DEJ1_IGNLU|nr:hypothetical protein ILUMI_04337 [Ignelater luminosus]